MPAWQTCARPLQRYDLKKASEQKVPSEHPWGRPAKAANGQRFPVGPEFRIVHQQVQNQSASKACQERKAKLTLKARKICAEAGAVPASEPSGTFPNSAERQTEFRDHLNPSARPQSAAPADITRTPQGATPAAAGRCLAGSCKKPHLVFVAAVTKNFVPVRILRESFLTCQGKKFPRKSQTCGNRAKNENTPEPHQRTTLEAA